MTYLSRMTENKFSIFQLHITVNFPFLKFLHNKLFLFRTLMQIADIAIQLIQDLLKSTLFIRFFLFSSSFVYINYEID